MLEQSPFEWHVLRSKALREATRCTGIFEYETWHPTIALLDETSVPFYFTDYSEIGLVAAAVGIQEVQSSRDACVSTRAFHCKRPIASLHVVVCAGPSLTFCLKYMILPMLKGPWHSPFNAAHAESVPPTTRESAHRWIWRIRHTVD